MIPTDRSVVRFVRAIRRQRSDLFHIQYEYRTFGGVGRSLVVLPFLTLLLSRRAPVVVTLHGLVTEMSLRGRRLKRLARLGFHWSLRATAKFASGFIVHSQEMRRTAEEEYGIHDVFVIPLGSDPVPTLAGARPGSNRIVFFGFIRPEKGLQPLLRAIQELRVEIPNIRLTIAGSVVHVDERGYLLGLQEMVTSEGLAENVRFLTKFLSDQEVSELLRETDVLVLPYTDRFVEVSGVVHVVAGFGVPLVCSTTPRFSELEDGIDCLKVAPESNELAKAIRRILRDPALSARLGEGLRRRSRLESWDIVGAKHLEVYREILRTHSPMRSAAE